MLMCERRLPMRSDGNDAEKEKWKASYGHSFPVAVASLQLFGALIALES